MVAAWPDAVERVAAFLRAAGAEARLEEFSTQTPTASAAAKAAGCKLSEIVKSLVLVCDGKGVVALVPGDRRLDVEKVRRGVDAATARLAEGDEVERLTGFTAGSVAPFPLAGVDRIVVERRLLAHPVVWTGGGSHNHLVRVEPAELVRLTRATSMDVVEEPEYHSQPNTDGKEP